MEKIFQTVNGVPVHTVFHYHLSIVLYDLNTVKKDVKLAIAAAHGPHSLA